LKQLDFCNILFNSRFTNQDYKSAIYVCYLLYIENEFDILQKYCQYLVNEIPILNFYLGICALKEGKMIKSKEYFKMASVYFIKKDFYNTQILNDFEIIEIDERKSVVLMLYNYYKLVIKIVEDHPDFILYFAKLSIKVLSSEEYFEELVILILI
jgi:hypothetical protein